MKVPLGLVGRPEPDDPPPRGKVERRGKRCKIREGNGESVVVVAVVRWEGVWVSGPRVSVGLGEASVVVSGDVRLARGEGMYGEKRSSSCT